MYIHFSGGTCYCGTDYDVYEEFGEEANDDDFLNNYSQDLCDENAESFEYMINGWGQDDPTIEQLDEFHEDCCNSWEKISKEEFEENS